jgi:hypothetical protein
MAWMREFVYLEHKRPVAGFDGQPILGTATFNIVGDREDDDFYDALSDLKKEVPPHMRTWDPVDKVWAVRVTEGIKASLCAILDNGHDLFDEAERQLELPWGGPPDSPDA